MLTAPYNKSYVVKALHTLSAYADRAEAALELALCHGALIMVVRRAKRGCSAEVRPNDIAIHLAEVVLEEQRLRIDWLETDVAIFLAEAAARHALHADEFAPGVVLTVNASARVLAMKLHLLRAPLPPDSTDAQDAEFLLGKISVSSPAQVTHIYARAFPDSPLSDTAHRMIERVFRARFAAKLS